tara:strand:+ start:4298 stop:5554 length:1257 start_codon:yes stop_codon:yes gene_type:complete
MINKINNLFLYRLNYGLFVLLPLFLISGPLLADLALSLIVLIFLYQTYCDRQLLSYYKNKFVYFFLIFWLYLLFNSIFQNQNFDSLRISFFYFRFIVFSLAIWHLIDIDEKILKNLFYSFLFCFSILIIDGFYQLYFGYNILGMPLIMNRVSSFFGDELVLGSYISRLFPIFFALAIYLYKDLKKNFLYIVSIIFILSETLVFVSAERTSFFFINLSAIFIIFLIKDFKKLRIITLLLSLVLISGITYFNDTAKKRIFDNTIEQFGFNSDKFHIFSWQHTEHYKSSLKMLNNNKLFGVGVKNFRIFCSDEKYSLSGRTCNSHPHNTYIQLLAETGFIGFAFIFGFFMFFLYQVFRHFYFSLKKIYIFNDFEIALLSAMLITLWPLIPTGSFFNNYINIIYIFPCGIFLWSRNHKKRLN